MFRSVVAWNENCPDPSLANGFPLPIVWPRCATDTTLTGSDGVNITSPNGTVAYCLGRALCFPLAPPPGPGAVTRA